MNVNLRGFERETRIKLLKYLKDKYGYRPLCRLLGISRSSMHRYLNNQRSIPNNLLEKMLRYIERDELTEILSSGESLKVLGFIYENGSVNYKLAAEFIKHAVRDEYLRNFMIDLIVQEYREELKKALGVSFENIVFKWDSDFEYFLRNIKRRRRISSMSMMSYYKSIFMRYLEGRRLNVKLVDEIIRHENKWIRNIARHYIQYLYYKRGISPEAYGWLMNVIPSRSYRIYVKRYKIEDEDIRNTFKFLRENHEIYYIIYRLMLESGARYMHILRMIRDFNPDEYIDTDYGYTKRLVIFNKFARYYLGLKYQYKRCDWIYMSIDALNMLKKIANKRIDRNQVRKYVKRHNLILPKYIRKYSWRLMVKVLGRELSRFLQSRFGELKISEKVYEDLLSEADEKYLDYLKVVEEYI